MIKPVLLLAFGYVSSLRTPPLRESERDEIFLHIPLYILYLLSSLAKHS